VAKRWPPAVEKKLAEMRAQIKALESGPRTPEAQAALNRLNEEAGMYIVAETKKFMARGR
jgi:hypothetical protein